MTEMSSKPLLVIGKDSRIGRAVCEVAAVSGLRTIATGRRQLAGEDQIFFDFLESSLDLLAPAAAMGRYAVVCAAFTDMNRCDSCPEAKRLNCDRMTELLDWFGERGVVPIFLSSNYIFDGSGQHRDDELPSPITAYGRQKAMVEAHLRETTYPSLVLRLSHVYGVKPDSGCYVEEIVDRILSHQVQRGAVDQIFCPTFIGDVAEVIIRCAAQGVTGRFNIGTVEKLSRYDLACRLREALDSSSPEIVACSINDFGFPELRPRDTSFAPSSLVDTIGFRCREFDDLLEAIVENAAVARK